MREIKVLLLVIIIELLPNLLYSDGLILQLPKDGTWADYQFDFTVRNDDWTRPTEDRKNVITQKAHAEHEKGKFRIASIGKVTNGEETARWIEFVITYEREVERSYLPKKEVMKVLVSEKYLVKGENPLNHAIEAWTWRDPGQLSKLSDAGKIAETPMIWILAGPLKDAKSLPKVNIETKYGNLACEGEKGTLDHKLPDGAIYHFEVENRLHPDSPFGVVSSQMTGESPETSNQPKLNFTWSVKLIEYGNNATSAIPDSK
jgi:hypothetical protein